MQTGGTICVSFETMRQVQPIQNIPASCNPGINTKINNVMPTSTIQKLIHYFVQSFVNNKGISNSLLQRLEPHMALINANYCSILAP